MCGRYSHQLTWSEIHDLAGLAFPVPEKDPKPNFNVAPTHFCPVVLTDGKDTWGETAYWGFVPHWWKKSLNDKKFNTINAKAEEIHKKATYSAAVKQHRCLVPATCFYEWRKSDRQPFAIGIGDGNDGFKPFLMAGIWSRWTGNYKDSQSEELKFDACTFTILTREAGDRMAKIHTREPAILTDDEIASWMYKPLNEVISKVLEPTPSQLLYFRPVGKAVGNVRNNSPDLMQPESTLF
ncbi:SOS response-associated peptidase [Thalassospira xiamenensis]|uniref:Abasic site processing protein n=1 Tax=Thalassospira xiamenensis TaxID=220697 RepID=A0A285TRZ9_9PROT|nr:SOS response-associated peptidase [Thalassospira xiamenensis]SOC26134.1 Putative SOS response-associated peptidase YedK [Thalassospira xiamenensis]